MEHMKGFEDKSDNAREEKVIKNHLPELYGPDYEKQFMTELKELAANSNIPFDSKFLELGISFVMFNAKDISEGKKKECTLKALISTSFGEAAIYKYNVAGGKL